MVTIEDIFKHIKFISDQDKAFASILYLAVTAERKFETFLSPFNISPQQYRILRGLRDVHPKGIPIYNLGQFLPDPGSDTSRLVTRMQKSGWVDRVKDIEDKRIINAIVSEQGLQLLAEIDESIKNMIVVDIDEFTAEQAKQLNDILQLLVNAFYKGSVFTTKQSTQVSSN